MFQTVVDFNNIFRKYPDILKSLLQEFSLVTLHLFQFFEIICLKAGSHIAKVLCNSRATITKYIY